MQVLSDIDEMSDEDTFAAGGASKAKPGTGVGAAAPSTVKRPASKTPRKPKAKAAKLKSSGHRGRDDEDEVNEEEEEAEDDAETGSSPAPKKGKAKTKAKSTPKAKAGMKRPAAASEAAAEPGDTGKVLRRPASNAKSKEPRAYKYMYYKHGKWGIKWQGHEVMVVMPQVLRSQLPSDRFSIFPSFQVSGEARARDFRRRSHSDRRPVAAVQVSFLWPRVKLVMYTESRYMFSW